MLVSGMPSGVVHSPIDSASGPPSSSRGNHLPTQSQASYHSVSSSPSARRPSSAFDSVNKEANVRANAAVVPGYADVRASAVTTTTTMAMTVISMTLSVKSSALHPGSQTSPDLGLAFGAVDVNVDRACTSLLSPLSHLPPPLLLLLLLLGSPSEIQEFSPS